MTRLLFACFLLIFSPSLFALRIDPSSSTYESKEKKFRIDTFDFSGEYPNLENIDIDGRRKKRVEMDLSGEYPLLEKINYEGSFGNLIGKLTGSFPKLALVNFLCSSATMQLDLDGEWKQDCEVNIRGSTGNIELILPKDVGVIVHTKTDALGKVLNSCLKKKGWGFLEKTYVNDLYSTAPVKLTINIEVTKAKIFINECKSG